MIESDGETSETTVWLDFSKDHKYISEEKHEYFITKYDEVAKMLNSMINQLKSFAVAKLPTYSLLSTNYFAILRTLITKES